MATMVTENCPRCGSNSRRIICRRQRSGREWKLVRCQACRQHFTSPIPTDEQICSFYEGDYHSDLRKDQGTEAAFELKYQRYADTLGRHLQSGRVVDVGCSTGLLVSLLSERGYLAEGIELNAESAEWGRKNYGVVIHSRPLEQCPYPENSLDAILFTDVLEHTAHPCDYLKMAGLRLVSGGLALVTFADICSIESRYNYLLSRLLCRDWIWGNCHVPLHVWEFTPSTAVACFDDAGFDVVEFRRSQPAPEPVDSLLLKVLNLPTGCLSWRKLGEWFGTQMEFVIRKRSET